MKSLHPAEHALNEYESIIKQDEKVKDYIQKVNPIYPASTDTSLPK
jgi:hypothetical protein